MRRELPVINNCDDCGACCTGQAALPVHLVHDDKPEYRLPGCKPLPPELRAELKATVERMLRDKSFPPDGTPCIWYDAEKKQCRHYEYRPTLCRDEVKPGDEACRRWRKSCEIDGPKRKWRMVKGKMVEVKP